MEDPSSTMESSLSLKEQKEMFVTGHVGTSPWEILLVCSVAPIGIWLFQSLRALEKYLEPDSKYKGKKETNDTTTMSSSIALEAMVLWLPLVICQTNLLYPWGTILLVVEIQVSVFVWLYFWTTQRWMKIRKMEPQKSDLQSVREDVDPEEIERKVALEQRSIMRDTMTVYRSSLQYLTFVAILAVDFHVFPRRFAKTETSGYGLMDLGAGSFVAAAGMVSSRARRPGTANKAAPFGTRDLLRIAPLLLIGFIRLATNKGLEYQEHVSEYGVHWNFFFTLAMVTPLGSMLPGAPTWFVPTLLLAGYQVFLTLYGGQDYIETAPRTHCNPTLLADMVGNNAVLQQLCWLFAANREGILGCIGYLCLYFFSEYIAFAFLWSNNNQQSSSSSQRSLWIIAMALWLLLYVLVEPLGIPVSRRSTNASFCVWTMAHSMILLAAIFSAMSMYEDPQKMVMTTTPPTRPRVPIVFQAVNKHGFLAFLIANLLTGLTNLTINTLAQSDAVALLILFVYLSAVGGFSLALHIVLESRKSSVATPTKEEKSKVE